ncbi:dephospho-CoA kinase [Polaribacter sp. Asnod1-A03]|uniref:dephospho-CoA kinase n=1 Tax=Polaribacter sp. Asnod1-A03 TaxID=3160581 RepID=UPI00386A3946
MVVGLTGGIGSGKTTVANIFKQFKTVEIYCADDEAKKLMNTSVEIKSKLIDLFGEESYIDNQLNRSFIASIVFKDKTKLNALNAIVHPVVKKHFKDYLNKRSGKDYILYENAILFESKSNLKCDIIISVFAPKDIRIERTMLRDGSVKKEVENRINNQWLEGKKLLQSNYVINNFNNKDLDFQVFTIHNILTKKRV